MNQLCRSDGVIAVSVAVPTAITVVVGGFAERVDQRDHARKGALRRRSARRSSAVNPPQTPAS